MNTCPRLLTCCPTMQRLHRCLLLPPKHRCLDKACQSTSRQTNQPCTQVERIAKASFCPRTYFANLDTKSFLQSISKNFLTRLSYTNIEAYILLLPEAFLHLKSQQTTGLRTPLHAGASDAPPGPPDSRVRDDGKGVEGVEPR